MYKRQLQEVLEADIKSIEDEVDLGLKKEKLYTNIDKILKEREMYWKVKEVLEANGYEHYEISNFAKKGYKSKHNYNCWKQHSYLSLIHIYKKVF